MTVYCTVLHHTTSNCTASYYTALHCVHKSNRSSQIKLAPQNKSDAYPGKLGVCGVPLVFCCRSVNRLICSSPIPVYSILCAMYTNNIIPILCQYYVYIMPISYGRSGCSFTMVSISCFPFSSCHWHDSLLHSSL